MKIILVVLVAFMLLNYSCGKKENFTKKINKKKNIKEHFYNKEQLLNKVLDEDCKIELNRLTEKKRKDSNYVKGIKSNCIKNRINKKKYKNVDINKKIKDYCEFYMYNINNIMLEKERNHLENIKFYFDFMKNKNFQKLCKNHLNILIQEKVLDYLKEKKKERIKRR